MSYESVSRNYLLTSIFLVFQITILPSLSMSSGTGHGHGGSRGGAGIGIGIIPSPVGPGMGGRRYMGTISEAELREQEKKRAAEEEKDRKSQSKQTVPAAAPSKLSKPNVRYLNDLVLDIDPALMKLALANPAKAIKDYRRTLERARKANDSEAEQAALMDLGNVYFVIGWFSQASDIFNQFLELARNANNNGLEARAKSSLAAILIAGGDFARAALMTQEAMSMYVLTRDSAGSQMVLINTGVLEKYRGSFDRARSNFQEALERNGENENLELSALLNLARLDQQWGFDRRALQYFRRAADKARKFSDPNKEADILIEAVGAHSNAADTEARLRFLNQALSRLSAVPTGRDWVKKLIADTYLDAEMVDEADSYARSAGYDSTLGRLYLAKSQPQTARKHYESLLRNARAAGNLDETFTALVGLAKMYENTGNVNQAQDNYTKALQLLDEMRANLLPSERKNFNFGKINGFSRFEPARGLMRLAIMQKKGSQGVAISESIRGMNFSDNLARNFDFDAFGVPQEILETETALENKIASLKTALNPIPKQAESNRYNDLLNQIKRVKSETDTLQKQIAADYPTYYSLRRPEPISLEASLIRPEEYVLMYDLLGDSLGVRLLKGNNVIKSSFVKVNDQEIEALVRRFRKPFESAELGQFDPEKSRALYNLLVADFLEGVPEGSPITIVPDGLLALLPFEALVTSGTPEWKDGKYGAYPTGLRYLADRNPIVYYPSLTELTRARSTADSGKMKVRTFVMADPVFSLTDARVQGKQGMWAGTAGQSKDTLRLMAAIEDETGGFLRLPRLGETADLAITCKQLYGEDCVAFTGLQSSKTNFMSEIAPKLNDYRSMIFATHGFTSNGIPGVMEPALAFSMVPPGTDGFLTMSEVAALKTSADITALTACNTGVGVKLPGEGVMSMGKAFLSAGSKSVAMSLWSVSENSSVKLMNEFFSNLKAGQGKLDAWTAARKTLRVNEYEHPFFWAAFILVGERN
jgi:CHAT domain-containing protein